MDRTAFESALARDGYVETVERTLPPGEATPDHTHPFDARLLILSGTLIYGSGEGRRAYAAGESFEVARGTLHAEIAGPEGASYLAGRRR
ncbi:cupin domain-containing protein [Falsiroseomonas ponticola]|uniref:cupin domain-containing protein n=1 Tax=Falsiroseomonas ponticola TaxID=2786951 RepID=UPI001934889B|nr:cupin domain-containing protein [Roseomonas ponticola]